MNETKRVYEVSKIFERATSDESKERIVFEKTETGWVYHAPNAQNHTIEQLEEILSELKKLSV